MFTRTFQAKSEQEFIADMKQDDFPETDKMPIDAKNDFADSMIMSELDTETMPIELMAELEESRSSFSPLKQDEPEVNKPIWKFDFTDSALDLKSGTVVKERELDEDLFSKFFDK